MNQVAGRQHGAVSLRTVLIWKWGAGDARFVQVGVRGELFETGNLSLPAKLTDGQTVGVGEDVSDQIRSPGNLGCKPLLQISNSEEDSVGHIVD